MKTYLVFGKIYLTKIAGINSKKKDFIIENLEDQVQYTFLKHVHERIFVCYFPIISQHMLL